MKYVRALAVVISQYPALAIGFVAACAILAADYGIPVGGQHALDIQGVVGAAIALLGGVLTHTQVSPASPSLPQPAQPNSATQPAPPVV